MDFYFLSSRTWLIQRLLPQSMIYINHPSLIIIFSLVDDPFSVLVYLQYSTTRHTLEAINDDNGVI